jgi:SAM-dependent methyltransferase
VRIVETKRLNDGKGFNQGQDSHLIRIEDPADYDRILDNILSTNYYGKNYFQTNIGHKAESIKAANLLVAAMVQMLQPGSVLELGCGRGDILLLLSLCGLDTMAGIDISADAVQDMWPQLASRVHLGDLLDVCPALARQGQIFDTVVALDIWEHLHPARLDGYIRTVLEAATPDALFYFGIPAFGPDRSFGEIFPLEFEENRADFERGQPFSHLLAESVDPPIPVNGHLTWAPSTWWEQQFCRQGLVRVVELESLLHRLFDDHLFYAQRVFFIFHRAETPAARMAAIAAGNQDEIAKATLLARLVRAVQGFERSYGKEVLDPNKTLLDINCSLVRTVGQHREKIRLLVGLLRALSGNTRQQDAEGQRELKHTLALSLFERVEELANCWPLPRGRYQAGRFLRWLLFSRNRRYLPEIERVD